MIPYEPDDPAERQRLAMPRKNRMQICREAGRSHCTDTSCPLYISCPMSVATEQIERRGGQPSLWQAQATSQDGDTVPEYSTPTPNYTISLKNKLKKLLRLK